MLCCCCNVSSLLCSLHFTSPSCSLDQDCYLVLVAVLVLVTVLRFCAVLFLFESEKRTPFAVQLHRVIQFYYYGGGLISIGSEAAMRE